VKLLLDTHIWLWSRLEPERLAPSAIAAIQGLENELWLSPLSLWELSNLVEKRRFVLDSKLDDWIQQAVRNLPVQEAPLTFEVSLECSRVQLPHRDPVDRFLVATARVFELTLVTADERLVGAKGIQVLANR